MGRAEELGLLDAAHADVTRGRPATVLVGGEAGVGKTRLVREFVSGLDAYAVFGGCLELGSDGPPFAPFTAALRQMVRDLGADTVAELLPGGPGEVARLLPEFGASPQPGDRARLFEQVLALIERLAARRPLVLVVEDLHWADRSTRDLFVFLVRSVRAAPVLLLATYRTDELRRSHPLRPLLAQLERADGVTRLELPRLGRPEVAAQIAAILGRTPEQGLVDEVFARSEGNPLFVEALLCCDGGVVSRLSDSLRDLLLAGVERLPEETQRVLRVAAAGGSRVGHALLAAVIGLDDAALSDVLRPAVDGNVLVADGDGFAFRHELIREAVHDELLPGEHARFHKAFAEAIEADPGLVPGRRAAAQVAHHWYAAHDNERALVAAARAAQEAECALAWAGKLRMIERVLELWDRVPDAERLVGADHLDVMLAAVRAARLTGEDERGEALATAALEEIDLRADAERAAQLLELRGKLRRHLGHPDGLADLRRAVEILPRQPTAVRASVLASLGQSLMLQPLAVEAEPYAAEALEIARLVRDAESQAHALITLAVARSLIHGPDAAFSLLDEARGIAEQAGSTPLVLRVMINQSDLLEALGEHAQAATVARKGIALARAVGLARTQGAFLGVNLAEPLIALGEWDEATRVLERAIQLDPPSTYRIGLLTLLGQVAFARGDPRPAERAVAATHALSGLKLKSMQIWLPPVCLEAELAMARDRARDAVDVVERVMAEYDPAAYPRHSWPVLVAGARAAAELLTLPPVVRDRQAGHVLDRWWKIAAELPAPGPAERAWRATFHAEVARAHGEPAFPAWEAAVVAWETAGHQYELARVLARTAEAALAVGDRASAGVLLRRAARIAERLSARPLGELIDALARRARLRLGSDLDEEPARPSGDDAPARLGLTPRELDVLRLVAEGRTNRQIAAELVISVKTASVHVSNILAKLGVATRGEAAATAHRLRLFDAGQLGGASAS